MKKTLILAALVGTMGWTTVASAADALDTTRAEIRIDRDRDSAVYKSLAGLRNQMVELDSRKQGRIAVVGTTMETLGAAGLYPMLQDLIEDRPFEKARPSVRQGWRIGLLFAVGRQRNPAARAVLEHVVRTEADVQILTSAAEALGKLQDAEAAKALIDASAGTTPRALAILSGMGQCRRLAMVDYLASRSRTATGVEAENTLAALRESGNSWAWTTDVVSNSGEGDAVRSSAATALMGMWLTQPELRKEARKALLVVDAPNTVALVAETRKTVGENDLKAFEKLAQSLATNPLHKRVQK
jgi:hypothetical protein